MEAKKKEEVEKLRMRGKNIELTALCIMLAGGLGLLVAMFMGQGYVDLVSDDHITDQDMPVRDLENATYTYTADELLSRFQHVLPLLVASMTAFASGGIMLAVTGPSEANFHKLHCGEGDQKYCPECGLKLSRLEKK